MSRPGSRSARTAGAALLAVSIAACSTAAAPSETPGSTAGPSQGPSTGPSPTPVAPTGGLEHPTGATDIVLRFEETGGFVPIEHNATYAPSFTLYGDGTIVFRDPYAPGKDTANGVRLSVPFQVVKLDEAGMQALLEQALNVGGLAIAGGPYSGMLIDIPTSTFTITVGGQTKQVSVTGLSPESHPENAAIIQQLADFAEWLRTFADKTAAEAPYLPAAYRGVLFEVEQPSGPVVGWPWTDLALSDFAGGENELFKTTTLTQAQVEALGIEGFEGGMTGISLQSEGKVYTFSVRPLLPEETK